MEDLVAKEDKRYGVPGKKKGWGGIKASLETSVGPR